MPCNNHDSDSFIPSLVSIVMPLYNSERTIEAAIDSVLQQTYRHFELIIVDDCSKDESYKIAKSLSRLDKRIKLMQLPKNSGAGVARNAAIKVARGEYIAFLDSDDRWLPEKLIRQIDVFSKYDVTLVCSGYYVVDNILDRYTIKQPAEWLSLSRLLKSNVIGCLTAIYNVKKAGKVYMPIIRKRQDYALWLNIVRNHGPAYCIQETLGEYYIQKSSISSNKIEMLAWNYKMFTDTQGYSRFTSVLLTIRNAAYKIIKK